MKPRIGNHSFRTFKSFEKLSGTSIPRVPQFVHLVTMKGFFPDLSQVKVNVDRSHVEHRREFGECCPTVKGLLIVVVGIYPASFPVIDDKFFWVPDVFSFDLSFFLSSDDEKIKDGSKCDIGSFPGGRIPVPT